MAVASTIVVGTRDLLTPLRSRPDVVGVPVRLFPPEDIRAALETILDQQPRFVVLEHEFCRSNRGAAMIERLNADPGFASTEIIVVNGDAVGPLDISADYGQAAGLDWKGTRRAPRIRVRAGVDIQVDGSSAELVDLSTLGAQVVSGGALKPNQRVRIALPHDLVRLVASVAWANFELPKGKPTPQYRAGLEFASPDTRVLERVCVMYAQSERA